MTDHEYEERLAKEFMSNMASARKNSAEIKRETAELCDAIILSDRHGKSLARFKKLQTDGPRGADHNSLFEACQAVVANPQKAFWLRAVVKKLAQVSPASFTEEETAVARSLTTGDSGLGQALSLSEPVAEDVYNLMLQYGAFRSLGVVTMAAGKTKLASVTGRANSFWFTPANQSTPIPTDALISGASVSPECATLAALVEVSGEMAADGKLQFEAAFLQALVEGANFALDWASFRADGTDDYTDGGMTGIFADSAVRVATAAAGHTSVPNLTRHDFTSAIRAVAASALSRPCRWWISPAFLPTFLTLKDDLDFFLKPPVVSGGDWTLLGFPVFWTAVAPGTDAASEKICAFGRPDAYTVAIRQDLEIMRSGQARFAQNITQIRLIARARCLLRDATSLSVLQLAAA